MLILMSERNNHLLRESIKYCFVFLLCPPLETLTVLCLFGSQKFSLEVWLQQFRVWQLCPLTNWHCRTGWPFCVRDHWWLVFSRFFYMALLSSSVLQFVPIIGIILSQVERSALALVKFNMVGDCPALIYPDICPSVIFKLMFPPSIYHNSNGTESVQWQMTIAVGEYSVQYLEVTGSTFRNLADLSEALEAGCSWFIAGDLA